MSTVALNNRVTSDSDAAFASCTALPISQTTLNVEEMAGIDGLCLLEEVLSTVQDIATEIGEVVDDVAATASLYIFGGVIMGEPYPPPENFSLSPPPPERPTSPQEPHVCSGPIVMRSDWSCVCPIPYRP